MERNEIKNIFYGYVERMKETRMLSTPDLSSISDANEYGTILTKNFSKIGELASKNRMVINDFIKPLITSEEELTDETQELLIEFDKMLIDEDTMEEVDVHLSEVIDSIITNSELKRDEAGDENAKVIAMAKKVKRDYFLISSLTRFNNAELEDVRTKAIENQKELAKNLEKDMFERLNDEAKKAVLQFFLMGALLYESNLYAMPDKWWEEGLAIIDKGYEILNDSYYREQLPDYDWKLYELRIYYYGSFFAYSYIPESIAKRVYEYADKAVCFLEEPSNKDLTEAVDLAQEKDLKYMASVLAGYTSPREACDFFYGAYEARNRTDYSLTGLNKNLDTPSLYLSVVKMTGMKLRELDYDRYREIQRSSLEYISSIPKQSSVYMKCITLLTNLPMYFKEVPGGLTMEEFCIYTFAAIHPPTYVHINMVARLSECMARYLLEDKPELFIGFPGCTTKKQVIQNRDKILHYIYHAALCHDIGKLFIIDVISTYGRNLLDDEFAMIKNHPVIGAKIASMHDSTYRYTDVIRGHHLWYDCSRGYPEDFDTSKSPYKTVIDIVMAADCLDAATDTVGRSYNRGKNFEDYKHEVEAEAGTRYAPFLPDLFHHPELQEEIEYLLDFGRKKMYRETFQILK